MSRATPRPWGDVARCPRCGQLVAKDRATKIGKRFYGPDCAALVLHNMANLRVIEGGVDQEKARSHSYMWRRAREREDRT